jgi:hypothetical protein
VAKCTTLDQLALRLEEESKARVRDAALSNRTSTAVANAIISNEDLTQGQTLPKTEHQATNTPHRRLLRR